MKTVKLEIERWYGGGPEEEILVLSEYPNGQARLHLETEDGNPDSKQVLTKRLEGYFPPTPRHTLMKNYMDCQGLVECLEAYGVIDTTGFVVPSGHVYLPEVVVNIDQFDG